MAQFSAVRRFLSSRAISGIKVSNEVKQALSDRLKPVIALESTIITHGLPFPQNLEMARTVEKEIRNAGGIPATCAFVNGQPLVGLEDVNLNTLADFNSQSKPLKVSRRDVGYVMASRKNGGTTIALTMILAAKAGIRVFATGGLGGVHRDGQNTLDVSADLTELGRTPVSVVCAGPKSILDIGLTLEFLETQGVFVGTYNEGTNRSVDIPGFYTRESGFKSPYSFDTFEEAALIIYNQNVVMGLKTGNVFCIPPSEATALLADFINSIIEEANAEAVQLGIKGKEITPFLLSRIAKLTEGQSVKSNIELVLNNARASVEIAKSLLQLELENPGNHQPIIERVVESVEKKVEEKEVKKHALEVDITEKTSETQNYVNTLIIGSLALDSISKISGPVYMKDSNPGQTSVSIGGVGFNMAKACGLALKSPSCNEPATSRFVSIVGDDVPGRSIMSQIAEDENFNDVAIKQSTTSSTAQYSSIHTSEGDLIIACADMNIIESEEFSDYIISEVQKSKPNQIIVDCNLSSSGLDKVISYVYQNLPNSKIIVEPTSAVKAERLAKINSRNLKIFPHNSILLITPTVHELECIHDTFATRELFDDYDYWFPLLDTLGADVEFRNKLSIIKSPILEEGLNKGFIQQSIKLLPYIPNILLKLGEKGLLLIKLSSNVDDYKSIPTVSPYRPELIITSKGKTYGEFENRMGVVIEYFPIPEENRGITIENVTGAGDSFLGYLAARMLVANVALEEKTWLNSELTSVEQEWFLWESIYKAQLASGKSLQTEAAVANDISLID